MAKTFARVAGWVALLLGVLGFFVSNLLDLIQFDTTQNVIHLVLGILGIAAGQSEKWAKAYAQVFGVIYLVIGITGFFFPELLGMHLEVTENLIHLILGAWGLYAVVGVKNADGE
jgi:hypothetical protein